MFLSFGEIILRGAGLFFGAYTSRLLGAEILGIYGLISSVYIVFSTISISGVRFGVTRICSEEIGKGNPYPKNIIRKALLYSTFFGFLSMFIMLFTSEFIANKFVGSADEYFPLTIMAFSMPFISFGGIFEGYFSAKQKVMRLVTGQIINQGIKIVTVISVFSFFHNSLKFPTVVLSLATTAGEIFYAFFLFILYIFESFGKKACFPSSLKRLVKTSLPLAVSAYMRTGLTSLGHMMVPLGLKKAGYKSSSAFTAYGTIHQMTFPLILFPACLLTSLGDVLIPRLTYSQVKNERAGINYVVNRALRLGIIFSFGIFALMFFYADSISLLIYKSKSAGIYIRLFSPLIPVMYCDCVTDGCLKGLNEQLYSMRINVIEGVLNVALLFFLLPVFGIKGYIVTFFIKEIFNTTLSLKRLSKITELENQLPCIISCISSGICAKLLTDFSAGENIIIIFSAFLLLYCAVLYCADSLSREDFKWIFRACRNI